MKKVISSILFAILIGSVAAFFRPASPYQVEVETKPALFPRGGSFDALDNADIAEDQSITPARKCGFCMGVSNMQSFCLRSSLSYSSNDTTLPRFYLFAVSRANQLSSKRFITAVLTAGGSPGELDGR
jgi:hypothetical protein